MRRPGFTLIELLVATGLAMALAAAAASAFAQVRDMVRRREAVLTLHRCAETLHLHAVQRLDQLAQHGVLIADARTPPAGGPRAGLPTLWLCFLRGVEHPNRWGTNPDAQNNELWRRENSDLVWELWEYRPEERILHVASSSRQRSFTCGPLSRSEGGVTQNLNGQAFAILPRPRRSVAGPAWWEGMNDNRLFPTAGTWDASDAAIDDRGDFSELQEALRPLATGVEALDLELVGHDGSTSRFSAAWAGGAATATSSGATPWISPGLRMDGAVRDAAGRVPGAAGWSWAGSDAAQRPRLLRLRATLRDPATGVEQVFSHSFALPSLAGVP